MRDERCAIVPIWVIIGVTRTPPFQCICYCFFSIVTTVFIWAMATYISVVNRIPVAVCVQVPEFFPVSPVTVLGYEPPRLRIVIPGVHVVQSGLGIYYRPGISEAVNKAARMPLYSRKRRMHSSLRRCPRDRRCSFRFHVNPLLQSYYHIECLLGRLTIQLYR
jgi:hypothetical protein